MVLILFYIRLTVNVHLDTHELKRLADNYIAYCKITLYRPKCSVSLSCRYLSTVMFIYRQCSNRRPNTESSLHDTWNMQNVQHSKMSSLFLTYLIRSFFRHVSIHVILTLSVYLVRFKLRHLVSTSLAKLFKQYEGRRKQYCSFSEVAIFNQYMYVYTTVPNWSNVRGCLSF